MTPVGQSHTGSARNLSLPSRVCMHASAIGAIGAPLFVAGARHKVAGRRLLLPDHKGVAARECLCIAPFDAGTIITYIRMRRSPIRPKSKPFEGAALVRRRVAGRYSQRLPPPTDPIPYFSPPFFAFCFLPSVC